MQIDFHHTAIYVLCRLAGMKSRYAEKVAYASQQVDDANYDHALKFKNGGVFHQVRTAHENLAFIKMADVNDAFNVWIPFHFLPAGEGSSLSEALITRPRSCSLELLKEEVTAAGDQEYGLHWLGIFLHLHADAYSHQDFKGFYDSYNAIEVIGGLDRMSFRNRIIFLITKHLPDLFPIGHAVAAKNPDIPYATWSYRRGARVIEVDNLRERFVPALIEIFSFLLSYLEQNPQYGQPTDEKVLSKRKDKLVQLLKVEGDYHYRHQNWLEKIHSNYFSFSDFDRIDAHLSYDRRGWFREAVTAERARGMRERLESLAYNFHTFTRSETFASSDWVLFMRAAALHRYRVIHEILPHCGLEIG